MPLPSIPPEELSESQEAFRQFRATCARAFAGTRWQPYRYSSSAVVNGRRLYTMELRLTLTDLLEVVPTADLFPRPAAVRDPRFHLRGPRPKRGRHARRKPWRVGCYQRG